MRVLPLFAVGFVLVMILAPFWVYSDASRRYEQGIGCLWALIVVALGPLALIAYLLVRPPLNDQY